MSIIVDISEVYALAPGLTNEAEWLAWAQHGLLNSESQPPTDLIPSNMRRRMSLTSKLAIQAALNISSRHDIDYGIFVSRHGELQRTFKLLNDILAGEEASPTAFSQSVHNTASGLFTIVAQKAIPVTSLAACQDSFLQGVIEAYARLNSSDDKKVLLTCFDDFVPDVYSSFADELPFCYALAILLEKGDSWEIASEENTEVSNELRLPQALQFMQSYTLQKKSFYVDGTRNSWMWTCAS